MFGSSKLKKIRNQTDIVFKTRFLRNLSLVERYEFLQLCHRRKYKEGEYIYYQGDPGSGMYFIEEGRVQLLSEPEEQDKEDEKLSYVLEAPESFGALSIGYELRRMSSVKSLCETTLLGFFQPDFSTLKDRHPKIAIKILEELSMIALKQLENTTDALIEASNLSHAFSIQFETFYRDKKDEPLL